MDLIIAILLVVTKNLPLSPRSTLYKFLSRCKFSTLTTRQPLVKFYLLTFPRFPLRKKEDKSYFGKNRTHDFRTSRCAGYLLDHSGDEWQNLFMAFKRCFSHSVYLFYTVQWSSPLVLAACSTAEKEAYKSSILYGIRLLIELDTTVHT